VQPSYDAASNVIGVATTLATGTDHQAFCYDALNRLTWAGATGTPPCGGSLTWGSLTSANYTQTFTYDNMDRLTSGPAGSYGDSAHPDAATSIGAAYTAAYDAVGDMVCRAPTASQTCAGTPTGATLTYDNEGRLGTWQNTPSSPTTTDSFLYDGEGNRIEQVVQQSGVGTTDTVYVGGLEEVTATTPTGGQPSTSVTAYYGGIALSVNTALSFLVSDGLGTATEALNTSGQVSASRLYTPYGQSRYTSGTFPTEFGFTGYRADTITGLNYANARYYDPAAGQFGSADTTLAGGANRFGYVEGNPETVTDPSGHDPFDLISWLINLIPPPVRAGIATGFVIWSLIVGYGQKLWSHFFPPSPPSISIPDDTGAANDGTNTPKTPTVKTGGKGGKGGKGNDGNGTGGGVIGKAPKRIPAPGVRQFPDGNGTDVYLTVTPTPTFHLAPGLINWEAAYAAFLGATLVVAVVILVGNRGGIFVGGGHLCDAAECHYA